MLRIHSHTTNAVATLRRAVLMSCMLPVALNAVAEENHLARLSTGLQDINKYMYAAATVSDTTVLSPFSSFGIGDDVPEYTNMSNASLSPFSSFGTENLAILGDTIYADQLFSAEALMRAAAGADDPSPSRSSRSSSASRSSSPSIISSLQPLHRAPRVARASAVPASQCLLDSIIGYDHDGAPTSRTYYRYDAHRYQTLSESYTLSNGIWVGKQRTENAYDEAGHDLLSATYTWRNGAWAGSNKTTYAYDAAGRNTDQQAFLWSATDNDWTNNYRYTYEYNAAGKKISTVYYTGDGANWIRANHYEYDYDAMNNEILNIYYGSYDATAGMWVGSTKVEKTYDSRRNITLQSEYTWSVSSQAWVGKKQVSATFNAQNQKTQEIKYTWRNGAWANQTRTDTEYDAQGHIILSAAYRWSNDRWEGLGNKVENIYKGNTLVSVFNYVWEKDTWAYSGKTEYTTNAEGGEVKTAYTYTNGAWVGSQRTDHTTDAADGGKITTIELWKDSVWVVAQRTKSVTVKNSQNLTTLTADFIWQDSVWVPFGMKSVYAYDERKNVISQVRSQYANGTWTDVYKSEYRFDANNLQVFEQSYNWSGSKWVGSKYNEATYDEHKRQIMSATYDWSNKINAWVGGTKNAKVYNAIGQLEEEMSYSWDWNSNQWSNLFRHVYTYDASNRTTVNVLYRGNGEAWDPDMRYENEYDASGRRYETRESEWYGGQWTLRKLASTAYDDHNRQTATLAVQYSRGVLQSYERDEYNYFCGTCHGVAPATTICLGDSALFCGRWYSTAGDYSATIPATEAFYDSLVTWTLHVQSPTTAPVEQQTLCANLLPYRWHHLTCDTAGTYRDTAYYYATGCDSVYYTLHLSVNAPTQSDTMATICTADLPYRWYEHSLSAAGTATRTIPNALGCDSTITLHLVVNEPTTSDTTATVCTADLPYRWYEHSLSAAGTATRTIPNANGCDSTITLHLMVNEPTQSDTMATVCTAELPYRWYEHSLNAAGTATRTIPNAHGCDSTITLHLVVNEPTQSDTTATVCTADLPYRWYAHSLNAAGTATRTIPNAHGCDSTITLHLMVNEPTTSDTTATICTADLPYRWYEHSLNAAGTATRTIPNAHGCDSTITLHLVVNEPTQSDTTVTINAVELPYHWQGQTLTEEGVFTYTATNARGCDSVVVLTLHVLKDLRMWISVHEGEVTDSTYTMHTPDTIHVSVRFEPATAHAQVLSYNILEGRRLLTMHDDSDIPGTLMLTTNAGHEGGTVVLQATAQVAQRSVTAHLTLHVLPDGAALPDVVGATAERRLVMRDGVVYIERPTDHGPEYYDLCGKRVLLND